MSTNSLKYIYKVQSSRLVRDNWNLKIDVRSAKENKEVISLSDSQAIEFIQDLTDLHYSEAEVRKMKKEINSVHKLQNSEDSRNRLDKLYKELDRYTFLNDCVEIVMDSKADFDRANKGFSINDVQFVYLLATTNGGKNSTVFYVSEKIHDELEKRINNGRNRDVELVPAKLEAYKSLVFSSSVPVPEPAGKTSGVLVVQDCYKDIVANVIKIDDADSEEPTVTPIELYPLHQNVTDGFGIITPQQAEIWAKHFGLDYIPSGFQIRNSMCKGMLFVFDFHKFSELEAKTEWVVDAWNIKRSIIQEDTQIVLTTSMLKLWSSYDSIEHYLKCCKDNGYTFRVNKVTPRKLDDERDLNYQFIQPLLLSESTIDDLTKPTITEIKDIQGADYRKSILYLSGENQTDSDFDRSENDCTKALKIDKRMINDPFVRSTIHKMIGKRINNAKMGELRVKGNYSIVSGDPYTLCQSMFGMETTGLLNANEFYSKYWTDKGVHKVAAFRAPMTSANNIRLLNLKNTKKMQDWYQYMQEVTIFNSFCTAMNAMNGMDADGDAVFTTNFPPILENVKELDAIICVQKPADKKQVTEKDLKQAVKNSFGDDIGIITNRITNMFTERAKFSEESLEYKALTQRIECGQLFQQNSIDRSKGIKFKPMPSHWYDYKQTKISSSDSGEQKAEKEFNSRVLANRSPYFLIYRYPHKMSEWKKYKREQDMCCLANFNCTVDELIEQREKEKWMPFAQQNRDKEDEFLKWFYIRSPISFNTSTMNRICWKLEKVFEKRHRATKSQMKELHSFDYSILMTESGFDKEIYKLVENIYHQYLQQTKQYMQLVKSSGIDKEDSVKQSDIFRNNFKRFSTLACPNMEMLGNIVVELCYKGGSNKSKQFAWDVAGEQIIQNLLMKNNNTISYPVQTEDGDFEFKGKKYSMVTKQINGSDMENEEDCE